ncbi:MAG: extensin family protein, partial [Myxococcales bacterium]|nr:extensin family protein [Myxococcales bacterium]
VTEVQYFSALRRGKIVRDKPRSQHNVGLALDLLGVRGPSVPLATIEQTYPRGRLRACPADSASAGPPGAPVPGGAPAADLFFALVCQAHARGLFHTILTPDHDRAHHNHLHLDLKAGQTSPVDPFISFAE